MCNGRTYGARMNLKALLRHRPLQLAALSSSIVVTLIAVTAGTADAATGTVNTAGSPLTVRASPGTSYDAWSTVADGASITISCQTPGPSVTGTYGTSTIWDMLSNGGFVSDAYVNTGSDGYVEHRCTFVGAPPRANPRSTNSAISWAFSNLGSTAYEDWCLKFTGLSYGWSATGWTTAEVGGDWIESHGYLHTTGTPPRGALVWYHNSAGSGHVVISLGEGKIIGTSVSGRVGVAGYLYHASYRGWSVPEYPVAV
jgi:uncharacterized protein YraI